MSTENAFLAEHFLTNSFGDKYLYSVNHNTLNKFGAAATHRTRFEQLTRSEDSLFIVVGSDSGTVIQYLANQAIGAGTLFVVVELPSLFDHIQQHLALPTHPQILFIPFHLLEATLQANNFNVYVYLDNIRIVKSLAADYAFSAEYHDFFFSLQEKLHNQTWAIQSSLGIQPFVNAQLANIADNCCPSFALSNAFEGQTAVLLAGGPSLDDILPWVDTHRDSMVVLAVSRICRRLLEINLVPDIIFSIDPHPVSFDVSKEMLHFFEKCLFINHMHASPLLLGQWNGRKIYLGSRYPWSTPLNQPSLETSGPTVANTALAAAVQMGFTQVVLAGVDLCHDKNGFTHAKGSNERQAGPQLGKQCTQVPTNGGWLAETSSDFAAAIRILGQQVSKARNRKIAFVNPAPGAAQVPNILHIPLDQIELPDPPRPPAEKLNELILPLSRTDRLDDLHAVQEELVRVTGHLQNIVKLAREALRCNEGLFGKKGRKQHFKHKKRMDKIEQQLNSKHREIAVFTKQYGIRAFLGISRVRGGEDWTEQEMEAKADIYYSAYRDTASQLLQLLTQTKARVKARMEEEKSNPDFNLLHDQWSKDNQPGRVLVWLAKSGKTLADLPASQREKARQLIDQYNNILEDTRTKHYARSLEYAKLGIQLRGKIQMYFQKKDREALQRLKQSLASHADAQARKYLFLCSGYLYELQDSAELALETYQELFEQQDEFLLEDALQRIAAISLKDNDIENGTLALKTLAALSPSAYLLKYGDLLWMTQNTQEALSAYLDYLEREPSDCLAMLKLGRYYQQLDLPEGARAMFEHVLKLDPGNATARDYLHELSA